MNERLTLSMTFQMDSHEIILIITYFEETLIYIKNNMIKNDPGMVETYSLGFQPQVF